VNTADLKQQLAMHLDALEQHVAAERFEQAKESAAKVSLLLHEIVRAERAATMPAVTDKGRRSHAPRIEQSPAKAFLDSMVRKLNDDESLDFEQIVAAQDEREKAVMVAPSLLQKGERYGRFDI